MANLILREIGPEDEASFLKGVEYWKGEDLDWYTFDWQPGMKHADHLERLRKNRLGLDLKEGIVPSTMLYAFVGQDIVGRINIRHHLNKSLEFRGGHIGYAVAPRFRGFGYATEIMRQSIPFLKALKLERVLLTCADENTASWKVIEACGGELESKPFDPQSKKTIRRYWLNLA